MSESRLDVIVIDYLKAAEAGQRPDPEEWIARHHEFATELRAFFEQHAKLQGLAARLAEDATVGPEQASAVPTIRYVGDYELLSEIARGGMGVVFRARQVTLGREVAVKMMLAGALAGETDLARFRTEAEAAAGLDHPNVLPLYEVGEHEGLPYFSMKLVGGGSLAKLIPELPDDPRRAAKLMALVARAVHHAHQRGVLHRDLKPANVLLDSDGTPYVSDFGLARRGTDRGQTQTGQILGTPSYVAPEQARAEKTLTVAVDVYALGAVLYECLTGRPPFTSGSVFDTIMQVIEKEPPHPRTLRASADADLSVIALKCLSKEPARRYGSAAELADDLERWLRGEPIVARPVGQGERVMKWVRRNPAMAALLALVVVTLTVGTVVSTLFAFVAQQEANRAAFERVRAHQGEQEARRRLARSHVISGNRLLEAGDDFGAMVWYAEALKLDAEDAEGEKIHRLRLGLLMRHAPRLKRLMRVPDGEQYLSGVTDCYISHVDDRTFRIREAGTHRLVWTFHGDLPSNSLEFARDGKTLLTISSDYPIYPPGTRLQLWSVADGKPLSPVVLVKQGAKRLRLTPDGKRVLAWLADGRVAVLDLVTQKEVFSGRAFADVRVMQMTPDGQRLLVAECPSRQDKAIPDATLHLLDGATLAPAGKPFAAPQHVWYPDFRLTHDGKTVIAPVLDEALLRDAATGAVTHKERLVSIWRVVLSDTGSFFALFGDQGTQAFGGKGPDAAPRWGKPSNRLARDGWFSPDAATVLASEGVGADELRLYDRRTGRVLSPALRGVGQLDEPVFADSGSFVVADSAGLLWTWEVAEQRRRPLGGPSPSRVAFSGDHSRYFLNKGGWQAYDGRTGEAIGRKLTTDADSSLWPNGDGSLAVASEESGVRLWDVARGTARPVPAEGTLTDVTWLSGGRLELSDRDGKRRRVLDLQTLRPAHREGACRVSYFNLRLMQWDDDDGREISLDPPPVAPQLQYYWLRPSSLYFLDKDTLRAWDVGTGKLRYSRKVPGRNLHAGTVGPNDRFALCRANARDQNELYLLNGDTGEPLAPPVSVPRGGSNLQFSPDGRLLAFWTRLSGAEIEFDVHVRDAATGAQLTPRLPTGHDYSLRFEPFSPDSRLLLANGRLYDATTGDPLSPPGAFPVGAGSFRADGTGVLVRVQERERVRPPGDDRKIDPELSWMIHEPLVWAEGSPDELLALAELLATRKVNATGALADLTRDEVLQRWEATAAWRERQRGE